MVVEGLTLGAVVVHKRTMANATRLQRGAGAAKPRLRSMKKLELPKRDPRDKIQKQFSVKLPVWIIERVDAIAEEDGYSRNEVVREILRSYFQEWDESGKTR